MSKSTLTKVAEGFGRGLSTLAGNLGGLAIEIMRPSYTRKKNGMPVSKKKKEPFVY